MFICDELNMKKQYYALLSVWKNALAEFDEMQMR